MTGLQKIFLFELSRTQQKNTVPIELRYEPLFHRLVVVLDSPSLAAYRQVSGKATNLLLLFVR